LRDHAASTVARFACGAGRMAPQPNPAGERKSRARILDEVLRSHRGALVAQARYHSTRASDVDDALSDACLAFLRNYNGPPGDDALNWMKALTKYSAWAISRRARSRESKESLLPLDRETGEALDREIPDQRDDPADLYERIEETVEIGEMFRELKPDERTALLLLGLGHSYEEIAEMRGWTLTKVNRCLAEGRERMRKLMREREGERL